MRKPMMTPLRSSRQMINAFGGYDHRPVIAAGKWYDEENLSPDGYPTMKVRPKRGRVTIQDNASTRAAAVLNVDGKLAYIRANGSQYPLIVNGRSYDLSLGNANKLRMIRMGAFIIILQDRRNGGEGFYPLRYFNTADPTDYGSVAPSVIYQFGQSGTPTTPNSRIRVAPCDKDGEAHNAPRATQAPSNPKTGAFWIDISDNEKDVLKQYDGAQWVEYPTDFICVYITPGSGCPKFDYLKKGMKAEFSATVSAGTTSPLTDLNGIHMVTAAGNKWVVFEGEVDKSVYIKETDTYPDVATVSMTVSAKVPLMDIIFECNNRLWGCRYGDDGNGNKVNEIYASALGDFRTWYAFEGISEDAYVASVGAGGPWTGGASFQGYPTFWKETIMYRVYGMYPAQYQVQDTACSGVLEGCEDSVAVVSNVLYYKSRGGVCAYDGSLPVQIGAVFGDVEYKKAVGGAFRDRYYISMQDDAGTYQLFCFDTLTGKWYREDNTRVFRFCECGDDLYALTSTLSGNPSTFDIYTLIGRGTSLVSTEGEAPANNKITWAEVSDPVRWYAETGDMGLETPEHKYVSRITVATKLAALSHMCISIAYDDGEFEMIGGPVASRLKSRCYTLPVRRCDHFRLRFEGAGDCQIYSLALTYQGGATEL